MDESLAALIEHYENVTNPEIKRSLLGEISKKLSLPKIRKIVRSKITTHELEINTHKIHKNNSLL